jgi:hypothetical protein
VCFRYQVLKAKKIKMLSRINYRTVRILK